MITLEGMTPKQEEELKASFAAIRKAFNDSITETLIKKIVSDGKPKKANRVAILHTHRKGHRL